MFEKFNHLARAAATNASRRQFLGRLGHGAMVAAAAAAGRLAMPADAEAARRPKSCVNSSDCPRGFECVGNGEGEAYCFKCRKGSRGC